MLQTLVKQREDSIFQFRKANRPELVQKEQAELEVLKAYLPEEASEAEIEKAVEKAMAETGAASRQGHRQGDEGGAWPRCRRRASRWTARRSATPCAGA